MTTPVLGLPEVTDGQASQGAIHNEALRELMAKTVRVLSRTTTAEPGSPADGDAYILAATHTGASWGGFSTNQIAHFIGGVWEAYTPAEGWSVWVNDEDVRVTWDASAWGFSSALTRWPSVAVSSSPFSVTTAHRGKVLICDTSGGNITLNLLTNASAGDGFIFAVKKKSALNTLTIDPSGSELIDDVTTVALTTDEDSRIVVSDASEWHSIGGGGSGGGGGLSLPLSDLNAIFKNDADASKSIKVDLSGLTTGTEHTASFPDKSGTFAYIDDVPAGGISSNALGENSASHNGLLYAYYAGYIRTFTTLTFVPGGTVLLTEGVTNYIECSIDGVVSANTVGFSSGSFPMATAEIAAGSPTTIGTVVDKRTWILIEEAKPDSPAGRLTLQSGIAIGTADQSGVSSVYYTPYVGNRTPLYSGTGWGSWEFAELTMALDTSNQLSEHIYDLFVFNDSGTIKIGAGPAWLSAATITVTIATPAVVSWASHGLREGDPVIFTTTGALPTGITAGTTYYVGRSPAAGTFNISTSKANAAAGTFVATSGTQSGVHTGSNATTLRGTGAGTTEIERQDGLWTNANSITLTNGAGAGISGVAANTALYIGSIYCTANGQTSMIFKPAAASGGSNPILAVFNAYNRVRVFGLDNDNAGAYTYSTATWRASNGNINNRVSYLDGLRECTVYALTAYESAWNTTNAGARIFCGVNLNSTAATPTVQSQIGNTTTANQQFGLNCGEEFLPSLGLNYIQAVEKGNGTTTGNFEHPRLTINLEM